MGENYTVEEYREALIAIYNMDAEERKNVFGISMLVGDYVKDFSASELIEKYRAYSNTPKTGEYWKANDGRNIIIVRYIQNDLVYYYYCSDGLSSFIRYDTFCKTFTKTERKSQYLELLIKEMEEASK